MKKDSDAARADSEKIKHGKWRLLTLLLLLLSLAACIFGIVRGEAKTVYRKGANICMECIGLG